VDRKDALAHNKVCFDRAVEKGASSTIPCLDLEPEFVRRWARGEVEAEPGSSLAKRGPKPEVDLTDLEGKDVLALAAGGGQQSAIFSLLGARVTVVEISALQLEGDRKAAAHYGYSITTLHQDMQDLGYLGAESFDVVYAPCCNYIPDIVHLYSECARVLRAGGVLVIGLMQPASQLMYLANQVSDDPYRPDEGDAIEYVHDMGQMLNGMIDAGFALQRVFDDDGRGYFIARAIKETN
jgi:SAM-dependent methyltransferase